MRRFIDRDLEKWRRSERRKPLLVRGARQVGKTYSIRQFGTTFPAYLEVNFERQTELQSIFSENLDPHRILRDLRMITGQKIVVGETLLFLDEIQEAERAVLALRYLYEEIPELHVIAAGSLLEFQIAQVGMPVGRVQSLRLLPMSFIEFLWAKGNELLVEGMLLQLPEAPIPQLLHKKTLGLLGEYMAIGGMPEVVGTWIETEDLDECVDVQRDILDSYRQDFSKYARRSQIKYLSHLFSESATMVGRKFKYSNISGEYRARELRPALDLLVAGCLLERIYHSSAHGLPLGAQVDLEKFKLLFLDIGLMQASLGHNGAPWVYDTENTLVNRGVVAEAFIGQELRCYGRLGTHDNLHYWHREARSSNAEVDYVIALQGTVIPVEVKSGSIGKNKSLDIFLRERTKSPCGVLLSPQNYSRKIGQLNLPLYCGYALCNHTGPWPLP